MGLEFRIKEDTANETINVALSGQVKRPEDVVEMYKRVIAYANYCGYHRILIDSLGYKPNHNALAVSQTMHKFVEEGLFEGKRIARIIDEDAKMQGMIGQYAAYMKLPIKNFTSSQEAISWLKSS